MDYILEVSNLSKHYNKSNFGLENLSFSLPYGTIMGLVGENGAGKTTTLNCILNILKKEQGNIKIMGSEMTDKNTTLREDIGVVFDTNSFSRNITAIQLSKIMKGVYQKWDNLLYQKYLSEFDLPQEQKLKTYSKGMLMKLSLAVALAHSPKLLILDEATSGLDPIVRDEILEVFLDFVQDEKHSILISSHITSDLEKIADYITFIHKGNVLLSENKDNLIYNYGIARCKSSQYEQIDTADIIAVRKKDFQVDVLVKDKKSFAKKYRDVIIDTTSIDDMLLLLVKGERI